jgi:DNA-binding GntR family transcriptional regulator
VVSGQPPETVANYVLTAIRSAILSGRYPLGSRLDQQALAEEVGSSIIPVRESLRQLEAEGLVRIAPRRGAYVAELSVAELREVYQIRELLEEFATRIAVERMAPADLVQLKELATDLDVNSEDSEAWLRLNREWHFRLYGIAQAPLLVQLIGVLWDRCSLYRHVYTRLAERRRGSNDDHRRILAACESGDAVAASREVAFHIRRAAGDVLAHMAPGEGAIRG